jgi:hypothetical protein
VDEVHGPDANDGGGQKELTKSKGPL